MPRQPKMADRVTALEASVEEIKGTLGTLVQQMALLLQQRPNSESIPDPTIEPQQPREESVEISSVGESRLAGKKVKLPVFEGDDPVAWITRAEIYFDVQQTPDEMRVKLSRLSMEGPTIHWFNLLMETEDQLSWEKLKKSLIARYGGRRLENPFEELSTLRQTGSVEEFVEAFELLSSQVGRLPEEQYLGYFMSGLKPSIRRRVRTLNPGNRMQMMRMAKDVEEEFRDEDDEGDGGLGKKPLGRNEISGFGSKSRSGFNPAQKEMTRSSYSGWNNSIKKTGSQIPNSNANSNSSSSLSSTGRKHDGERRGGAFDRWRGVRSEEVEERRIKGLCFKCGGKWHPTQHKCPERAMRVLILGEGEVLNDDGEIVTLEVEDEVVEEETDAECKILGVLGSMGEYKTMKIGGRLEGIDVVVLIDSGASHNFVSTKLTSALGLPITSMAERKIKLGDGHKVVSKGVCEGVALMLGEMKVVVDALVLDLGGLDVILGVSWLSTLGKVMMD
ncbi:retrotransposon-related protein [Trifolium pratense]|uniref:Retrotransposon-related protein n=1 Tax=Trifolium pratense TaxID=57577 RepID=A0A2K3NI53_TRIPR|nr:retrotransposon-related protein [Trifolium pratense]